MSPTVRKPTDASATGRRPRDECSSTKSPDGAGQVRHHTQVGGGGREWRNVAAVLFVAVLTSCSGTADVTPPVEPAGAAADATTTSVPGSGYRTRRSDVAAAAGSSADVVVVELGTNDVFDDDGQATPVSSRAAASRGSVRPGPSDERTNSASSNPTAHAAAPT